ncbi:MAG: polysaccharide deacetylase family protein [Clostridia bacterium]|nr:polysaccharide deacetylase family protein [Clostridia bacterium]
MSIAAVALYVLTTISIGIAPVISSARKIPIYSVDRQDKTVAITFDAAWGADKTQDIIKILKEYDIDATFFLVGFWVEKYPELTKEIHDEGFEIGTHSQTHPNLTEFSEAKISEELDKSVDIIQNTADCKVELFRPPFGAYNNTLIEICESKKLQAIQWDVDTLDWKGITPEQIALRVNQKVQNGSIILCHNNSKYIVEALPLIINTLQAKGFKFLCVGDLIYRDNFRIDHTGRQLSLNL